MSRAASGSATRRLYSRVRPRGSGRVIQGLGRDVGAVRPGHGATIQEELLKVQLVLERFEHWPHEPRLEVNAPLGAVVEGEVNPKVFLVLGVNDVRQKHHNDLAHSSGGIRSSG